MEDKQSKEPTPAARFLRYSAIVLALFTALNVMAVFALPHDKYLRYQTLLDKAAPTAYWIYERIHFDPHPIDVAFIGTSRTGMSIHTRRLEEDLAQRGVQVKAANLYHIRAGVNMQYVVAKELLENRRVKLLVLEMTEREERLSHEDFVYLADVSDVLAAPVVPNPAFFMDLVRLPARQTNLFLETELQRLGVDLRDFVPPPYEGPNLDHAEYIQTLDGVKHYRNGTHTRQEMEAFRLEAERTITPPILPAFLNETEFRIPRLYENRMLDLAAAHGTRVVFLYLPRYGGPEEPAPYERYRQRAALINLWPQLQDFRIWSDIVHLNWSGAGRFTDLVADALLDGGYLQPSTTN